VAPRKTIDQLLKERLQELGAIGGKASAGKLSKAERAAKASKAATARWRKSKSQDGSLNVHGDPLDPPKKAQAKKKAK
jgi:hypothetical protein